METGFLNFHDEEHFSDFSLSLDHQHNLLGESQSSLVQMVDGDFDYIENFDLNSNDALWETEQEINGDLAVLPASGVAEVIPKMENMKEDFAKVLTDWHEHIGYLQASEMEEDIDMVNLDMGLNQNLISNIFEDMSQSTGNTSDIPVKCEPSTSYSYSPIKFEVDCQRTNHVSESDLSEKEIDVVGLDPIEDVKPIIDFMHVRRHHASTPSKAISSKSLGKNMIKIKQEPEDIVIKEEPIDFEDEISPVVSPITIKTEYTKSTKKKRSKKHKEEISNKRSRKSAKVAAEIISMSSKKSKKESRCEEFIQETSNSNNVPAMSRKAPVLEAGDVKSLLEQFEATEAAAGALKIFETTPSPQVSSKKASIKTPVNKSQTTLLKTSVSSQDSKLHQDIRDSLPKEVIDRIKASSIRKKMISVIPAIPNTKITSRNSGTRMQEAAATLSRNKLLKLVANNSTNSNARVDGSVHLDHDYCSNSNSIMSISSGSSPVSNSEYDRQTSDSEQFTPIKEESSKQKIDCYGKAAAEHSKSGHKINSSVATKNTWSDNNSKKDSGLESGDLSDASEEHTPASKVKKSLLQDMTRKASQEIKKTPAQLNVLENSKKVSLLNKPATAPAKPVYEMKIQSALATSILKLRKGGVLTKTKSLDLQKPKPQMVSVLKKPPAASTPQKILGTNLKESIVTTTNSSNDQVQNIIVQDTTDIEISEETEKKPPRRKLNLAEYRSRREQNRSDGSRTNSPIQPMALVYIHHASTNTEPINDDPENPIWSEREIVSVLKPKLEIEEDKLKPKQPTRDRGMQTTETVFGLVYNEEEDEEQEEQVPEEQKPEEQEKMESVEQPPVIDVTLVKGEIEEGEEIENGEIESGEITNEPIVDNEVEKNDKVFENEVKIMNEQVMNNEEKAPQTTNINRLRDRKHRNYRSRAHASSGSSRSRSRSRSRPRVGRNVRRSSRRAAASRSRSRNRSRSHSRSKSRSRSSSSNRSRSRSRSRSQARRHTRRRRRISHRRSSVSSSSSWSSRSRSRSRSRSSLKSSRRYRLSSRSGSRSRSSRSRSRSSRYSSCSRSSSRSNFGHSKWSSRHRKGRRARRRSYDRHRRHSSGSSHGYNDWRRSPPPYRRPYDEWYVKEKQRQVEERRVIYVGRLKEDITKAELRRRFEAFGPVVDISIHFRERGHNYGFVTFAYKNDAYEAVEHGNDDPTLPRYDLCFGGRRAFCKVKYADLDGAAGNSLSGNSRIFKPEEENTFDLLLKEAQAKLRKRKV